ncbi:MAG: YgiQ family radical SAM protein [Bacteroidales bacterium]|nr:YgiQ family radical SAM protein [Bacteroidales bacterium]
MQLTDWLPTTKKELEIRGWDEVDVVLFSGDAYVDHPSFGGAVVGRILESEGLRVALVPQPNWRDDLRDFKKMGVPRMFFAISAGAMDSMVNHYTANKRLRSDDAYSPDGKTGFRPDRTTITYANILRQLYPEVPIVIGGIEASLRRLTHYDYWEDRLMPSILVDSKANLLIYGMGELPLRELARKFKETHRIPTDIKQTAYIARTTPHSEWNDIKLHSHEDCLKSKKLYAENFRNIEEQSTREDSARLIQNYRDQAIIVNPPFAMKGEDLDATYELPFTRLPHPKYKGKTIPAYEMIKHSVNIHRGCMGGCAFCTISIHQGRKIISRSEESILKEIEKIKELPDFKGYLSDLGGPSANMYKMHGKNTELCKKCHRITCVHPNICKNLNTSHKALLDLYRKVDRLPYIKKSFIGSGVRYDLCLHQSDDENTNRINREYMHELIANHVSGKLKIAPEHTADNVLKMMRKPSFEMFRQFKKIFDEVNEKEHKKQLLIPYFMSSHPGCTAENMAALAAITKKLNFKLEQIQDFTPTPMTLATEMYYTGLDPYTMKPVFTAKSKNEKLGQRKFFFWYQKEYRNQIIADLKRMGRNDLINKILG